MTHPLIVVKLLFMKKTENPNDTKECKHCGVEKPVADFPITKTYKRKDGSTRSYRRPACLPCYQKHEVLPIHQRARAAKHKITVEEMHAILAPGVCEICGAPAKNIDHCHDTGKIRGLLCNNCNQGLGRLGDNLQGLRLAVAYLEGYNPGHARLP